MGYLTTSKLAESVGCCVGTIRQAMADGRLQPDFYTPGGHARFSRAALDRFRTKLGRTVTALPDANPLVTALPAVAAADYQFIKNRLARRRARM